MNPFKFPPTLAELKQELVELEDWDERFDYLMDLGKQLPSLSPAEMNSDNLVRGCMSNVWMVLDQDPNSGAIQIRADSDSLIVKGLIVVLMALFDGRQTQEIATLDERQALAELGLEQHLSPQRRNGLFAMVKRIREVA